jgi:hypothetical protein
VIGPQGEPLTPHIRVEVERGKASIVQQRPPVLSALVGTSVDAALRLVPTLLPVCGQAQGVAARRAVAAAAGRSGEPANVGRRLWREQALAAAWRCCVDWADLLGEARGMEELSAIYRSPDDSTCAASLAGLVPGLGELHALDQLLDWCRAGGCLPARVVRRALRCERPLGAARCVAGSELTDIARQVFRSAAFDPLSPWPSALEVGPLAMARDPLILELQENLGATIAARFLAQVLDMRRISTTLSSPSADDRETNTWPAGDGTGIGRAITARGPVYHRVSLQGEALDMVADWRVLAPTDWHFSAHGPVLAGLSALEDPQDMRLLVTAYDPCTAWSLHGDAGEGRDSA